MKGADKNVVTVESYSKATKVARKFWKAISKEVRGYTGRMSALEKEQARERIEKYESK